MPTTAVMQLTRNGWFSIWVSKGAKRALLGFFYSSGVAFSEHEQLSGEGVVASLALLASQALIAEAGSEFQQVYYRYEGNLAPAFAGRASELGVSTGLGEES